MKVFGVSNLGCEVLFVLFVLFGVVMAFVYHDGGYLGTEPILVLSGCCVGAAFCIIYPRKSKKEM